MIDRQSSFIVFKRIKGDGAYNSAGGVANAFPWKGENMDGWMGIRQQG